MPEYNTSALKLFAQTTRAKLVSLIGTKVRYLLNTDDIASKTYKTQIDSLRKAIENKTEKVVVEEVAYTWFNRIMALRFMDANGYNSPMVVSYAEGQTRPEILQEALAGNIDSDLGVSGADMMLEEKGLYRRLLVASCNHLNGSMPFLFERITDYTELLLPDDLLSQQSFVTDIRNGMSDADCENVELMGWLYQFYIIDRKKEAEGNKKRSGGLKSDEQAAATQLFTPHWVVRYMVENSLGRIWMTLHPDSNLVNEMPYYIKPTEDQVDVLPDGIHSAADIRFIDPCMGSGHILVYAFDLFVKMYEEEGKISRDIPALIIQNNLFGIDIDSRCYQLACFAITMKARAYYSRYLRNTVQPNVIALRTIDRDVIRSTGNWSANSLMWQFTDVDTIGSLLKISQGDFEHVQISEGLFAEQQRLLKKQAEYLSREYHCVVTNPPYLGKGLGDNLKNYIQREYPNSKADTMATFMERCIDFSSINGKIGMINMHSWMFIKSYEKLRFSLLSLQKIDSLLHLGPRAFDEIGGEVVQCAAFVICKKSTDLLNKSEHLLQNDFTGIYYKLIQGKRSKEKESIFLGALKNSTSDICFPNVLQRNLKKIPGHVIGYWISETLLNAFENDKLSDIFPVKKGMDTGDNTAFLRLWFEVSYSALGLYCKDASEFDKKMCKWAPYNKGGVARKWFGNNDYVVLWEKNGEALKKSTANLRSKNLYFKDAITWNALGTSKTTARLSDYGAVFDSAGSSMFPSANDLKYVLAFMNSKCVETILYLLNPTFNFGAGSVGNLPYIEDEAADINCIVSENVKISKRDWNAHETSFDFEINELVRKKNELVQGTLNSNIRISSVIESYKTEWRNNFKKIHSNEELLNKRFIEIYGLGNDLVSDVPLEDVSILQKNEISIEDGRIVWHDDVIIKQFISYLVGCFMGRYSVDRPGLIIASQNQKLEELNLPVQTLGVDDDGIIPIIQEDDVFTDDMANRVENALKIIFGSELFYENLEYIKKVIGADLRSYFFKDYYKDHLQLYSVKGVKRPVYWMFNSSMGEKNRKGCFKALVYMHRIDGDTLSRLHADYVRPYLNRLELQYKELQEQSLRDDLSAKQKTQLLNRISEMQSMILEISAYEKRLIEMASARMTIDLDDGVRVNYPKFYPLVEYIKGLDEEDEE